MSYRKFDEIWSPLKLVGIKFFVDEEKRWWIKVGSAKRRRMNRTLLIRLTRKEK